MILSPRGLPPSRNRQSAFALLLAAALLLGAAALLFLAQAGAGAARRDAASDRALARAREALIAHAAERPLADGVGPGFLPCPDLDDDGWAEPICGSLAGDRGQAERLGRLPWKTLGLPDLRDGHGERLWYAVSTRYKGLLNCAASPACVDMTPATAVGTITVRGVDGGVLADGTVSDAVRGGAAAVVIAPGPALARIASPAHAAREQRRDCAPPDCDAAGRCMADPPRRAPRCDPANYLDAAPVERSGEDNAAFHDRSDGERARNHDGFIQGSVADSHGRVVVNDRVLALLPRELMPRVMRRVALEAAACLPRSGSALPAPTPACAASTTAAAGRLPDAALEQAPPGCALATQAPHAGWWHAWKPFVFYARCETPACLELVDAEGRVIARDRRFALVVSASAGQCDAPRLECDALRCTRLHASGNDRAVAVAMP